MLPWHDRLMVVTVSYQPNLGLRSFPVRDDRTIERAKAFRLIQLTRNVEIVITIMSALLAVGGLLFLVGSLLL